MVLSCNGVGARARFSMLSNSLSLRSTPPRSVLLDAVGMARLHWPLGSSTNDSRSQYRKALVMNLVGFTVIENLNFVPIGMQGMAPFRYQYGGNEELHHAVVGGPWWTRTSVSQFANNVIKLPFDAHTFSILVAPVRTSLGAELTNF